jgi:DNA-binding CsgD family transcriptional regulator
MTKQQKAIALITEGRLTMKQIAAEVRVSMTDLYKWKRLDGTISVREQATAETMKLTALYYRDHTLEETAAKFSISPPTVLRYVKKFGLTRAGDKIMEQGYFFGAQDREALGLTDAQAKNRNTLLASLGIDLQVSAVEEAMFLTRGVHRLKLSVTEAIDLTRDCRGFLKANAERIKLAFRGTNKEKQNG